MQRFKSFLSEAKTYEVTIKDDVSGEWPFPMEVKSLREGDIRKNMLKVLKKSKPTDWFDTDWLIKQYDSLDEAVADMSDRVLGPFFIFHEGKKVAEFEIPVMDVWNKVALKKDFGRWLK